MLVGDQDGKGEGPRAISAAMPLLYLKTSVFKEKIYLAGHGVVGEGGMTLGGFICSGQ